MSHLKLWLDYGKSPIINIMKRSHRGYSFSKVLNDKCTSISSSLFKNVGKHVTTCKLGKFLSLRSWIPQENMVNMIPFQGSTTYKTVDGCHICSSLCCVLCPCVCLCVFVVTSPASAFVIPCLKMVGMREAPSAISVSLAVMRLQRPFWKLMLMIFCLACFATGVNIWFVSECFSLCVSCYISGSSNFSYHRLHCGNVDCPEVWFSLISPKIRSVFGLPFQNKNTNLTSVEHLLPGSF